MEIKGRSEIAAVRTQRGGRKEVNKNTAPPGPLVSIIDERSLRCPGIAPISADLAALAAGLTAQVEAALPSSASSEIRTDSQPLPHVPRHHGKDT